jgi:hypothetical protein
MANSKISALTSATTPLAGTEVLPIVQSGSTVKVANNDLRPKQIQSNATTGVLQVAGPTAGTTRVMTVPDANFSAARKDAAQSLTGLQTIIAGNSTSIENGITLLNQDLGGTAFNFNNGYGALAQISGVNVDNGSLADSGYLKFSTATASSLTEYWRLTNTGNFTQRVAAKGINFTANTPAAGKTSQLLNWYEEGTFTPTLTTTGTDFTSVAYAIQAGTYTRVGRQVTVTISIRTNGITVGSASGNLCVGGLPFTSSSRQNTTPYLINLPVSQNFNTANPTHVTMYGGWNYVAFQLNNANTYATYLYANTGGSPANTAFFTFTYITD